MTRLACHMPSDHSNCPWLLRFAHSHCQAGDAQHITISSRVRNTLCCCLLQIPWGRWRGGALVVELSDVVLCISSRAESDWEEGPALRRAQAAKQAQLAAAELAKLGSRVAATGQASHSIQQADYAAATAAGAAAGAAGATTAGTGLGNSWGWAIVDYITSFLLNRLHFEVKNVHAFFEVSHGSARLSG